MDERQRKGLDRALSEIEAERIAQAEPSFEQLEAYAAGLLPATEAEALERILPFRPDLQAEVTLLRSPDPGLVAAAWKGFREGRQRAAERTAVERTAADRTAADRTAADRTAADRSTTGEAEPRLPATEVPEGAQVTSRSPTAPTGARSALKSRRSGPGGAVEGGAVNRVRTRGPGKDWRRFAGSIGAGLVVLLVALVILVQLPGQGGEVTLTDGAFYWDTGVRGEESVTRFTRGQKQGVSLVPPEGARYAVLLEVAEREVSLLAALDVQPGIRSSLSVIADGGPELSFLVIVYLERPGSGELLREVLSRRVREGTLLTSLSPEVREQRVLEALRTLEAPRMWIDVSNLYRIGE